jgi:hypothetical protein
MSMIGKLRQVSEFELAKFKKNPGELVRSLAGSRLSLQIHRSTSNCAKRCSSLRSFSR